MEIDVIRREMTRADFLIKYGGGRACPSYFSLNDKCALNECKTPNECHRCLKEAVQNIEFKGEYIKNSTRSKTIKEINQEPKKYAGWEMAKMMAEKQLKDGTKIVWHNNSTDKQTVFIMYNHFLTYEESKDAIEIFYLTHDINIGYFTIEEYMTFNEAKKLGTPRHKDKGYSYQDYKVSEFINEIDKKVWYV